MTEIENALWCGERIGDMPRERLLEVVAGQAKLIEQARDDWKSTLDSWDVCRKARAA
jgi:hypothetical protein